MATLSRAIKVRTIAVWVTGFAVAFTLLGYFAPRIVYQSLPTSHWIKVSEAFIYDGCEGEEFLRLHITREAKDNFPITVRLSFYKVGNGEEPVFGFSDPSRQMKEGIMSFEWDLVRVKEMEPGTYTAILTYEFYVEQLGATRELTVDIPPFEICSEK